MFHAPGNSTDLTGQDLIRTYTKYLHWYDEIPDALRIGQNLTSALLSPSKFISRSIYLFYLRIHSMYYHYFVLNLFRPFIKMEILGSSVNPSHMCNQAADAISGLIISYSKLYTLKRPPSFVPY